MKSFILFTLFFAALRAHAGPGISGGGDQCENRFKAIGEDIAVWIGDGGHQSLRLPAGVSTQAYAGAMIDSLQKGRVSCVGKGDAGYPVEVYGTPKICRFDRTFDSARVTCDFEKFRALTDEEQYVLVHHEYAGLAGLEPAIGDNSQYSISNQISAYLQATVVKKLAVRPPVDEKALCAKGIQEFVRINFPASNSSGTIERLVKVNVDKVEFIAASGLVDIEAHALYDEDGFNATRIFLEAQGLWRQRKRGEESLPDGCENYRIKASFPDPIAE